MAPHGHEAAEETSQRDDEPDDDSHVMAPDLPACMISL
jgi:hypothetical protein